jgi:hypothetical protein
MPKTPRSNVRKESSKEKSNKTSVSAAAAYRSPAAAIAARLDEDLIRERAYGT